MKKKTRKKLTLLSILMSFVLGCIVILITFADYLPFNILNWNELLQKLNTIDISTVFKENEEFYQKYGTYIHFINVGQGDATLIESEDKVVLIDGGDNDNDKVVINYLNARNISNIDLLIGTHPHADHIAGLIPVIKNIGINEILLPKVPDSIVPTTKTYENLLKSILEKNLKINQPIPGKEYNLNNIAKLKILAPLNEYEDLNNYSISLKYSYGEVDAFIGGDIEETAELDILESYYASDLNVDIFKLSHHGSSTSNINKFLTALNPKYYVISVGAGNKYGHPSKSVMDRIMPFSVPIYRTDKNGSIVFGTDGNVIEVITEK